MDPGSRPTKRGLAGMTYYDTTSKAGIQYFLLKPGKTCLPGVLNNLDAGRKIRI
jgi:hypothetical protein